MRLREGLFPELQSNEGNKHQNNTQVSTETVHHMSAYIIFLTWHNKSINDDKNDNLYTSPPVSHSLGFHSADGVMVDCLWRHNDQTIVMWSCE